MAGSHEWCRDWQPPPLPPPNTELFQRSFSYIRNNATHWENYKSYFRACNLTLPFPEETTTSIATKDGGPTATSTNADSINVKNDHVAVYIILPLLLVALVVCAALYIRFRLKKRRARANIASLTLKEYASTNYLDNKARNNQCWNNQVQEPCQSIDIDKGRGLHKIFAQVEPTSDTMVAEPLVINLKKNSDSIFAEEGYQNICFKSENESKENESLKSPSVNSTSPLYDTTDDGLLPNVPQNNDSVLNEKRGNVYEPFSVVIKSGQLPPIHGRSQRHDSLGSSPKKRKKRKTSSIQRSSEPLTNVDHICEDLVENRKSV